MSRGINIKFGAQPYTLQASTGKAWIATTQTKFATTVPGQYLLQQPLITDGIANHFWVQGAQGGVPKDSYHLNFIQSNKYQGNGLLVSSSQSFQPYTNFTPASILNSQLGCQNIAGSSGAQMENDTNAVYMNALDLPVSATDQKMMITPQYNWSTALRPIPFQYSTYNFTLDLQIPVATGTNTYIVMDSLFVDPNGVGINRGVPLFSNGKVNPVVGTGLDGPTGNYIMNTPLADVNAAYVTRAPTSAVWTGTPWTGFRTFTWSISQSQFVTALHLLDTNFPGILTTFDPTQYFLDRIHLNAEFHTVTGNSGGINPTLGWSMRNMASWVA